jgi:hypothetical protein
MPISWRVADGLVWLESEGLVPFEEWRAAVDAALKHPDYRPGMGVLHDWRGLHEPPEAADIRSRAEYGAKLGRIRWALVVSSDVGYGMGRMAEILTETPLIELRAFKDIAEAEAWARGHGERSPVG